MSTKEKKAYRQGQKDTLKILAEMTVMAIVFVTALVKAGIYVF